MASQSDDSSKVVETTTQPSLKGYQQSTSTTDSPPESHTPSEPQPSPPEGHTQPHPPQSHAPSDSDGENEEDLLGRSMEDEVGKLLRATVEELETALQESRMLLAERDRELVRLRSDLERYKQQAAREIANKTKLAQSLDESHKHARELEELLQQWQMEVRETKLQTEKLKAYLHREQSHTAALEKKLQETQEQKDKDTEQLKSQLIEARQKISRGQSSAASESNPGPSAIDEMQLHFLKQAVYHLLTDFHAEDQLRAIVSILNFSPQERKAVYAKVQEKKGRTSRSGLYM